METRQVKCAGGIVLGDASAIALVRNRASTKWFFPKGHVDVGESDEDAARREIYEETGLSELELIDDLGEYGRPHIGTDGAYDLSEMKTIRMFLFAAPAHAALAPGVHEGETVEEAQWSPLTRVAESLQDEKDRVWFAGVFERVRQAIQRD